jgi:hypothetical protein
MKSVWLVALLAALSATTMMITTDSAMARRGVHAGVHGVHVGNINRHPGWRGNYAGWRGGNWRRVGWGVGAAGLAIGAAAAASAYNYDGTYAYYGNTYPYDGSHAYAGTYAPTYYDGGYYQGGPRNYYLRPYGYSHWSEF